MVRLWPGITSSVVGAGLMTLYGGDIFYRRLSDGDFAAFGIGFVACTSGLLYVGVTAYLNAKSNRRLIERLYKEHKKLEEEKANLDKRVLNLEQVVKDLYIDTNRRENGQ